MVVDDSVVVLEPSVVDVDELVASDVDVGLAVVVDALLVVGASVVLDCVVPASDVLVVVVSEVVASSVVASTTKTTRATITAPRAAPDTSHNAMREPSGGGRLGG